jgi:hypothetical protein
MRTFLPLARWARLQRRGWLAAAALVALAATGIAAAGPGPASTSIVSATFYANTLSNSHSATCTGANNDSIQVLDATFTGTATSTDSHLNGPLTIHVRSLYDSTTGSGWLNGDFRVANSAGPPPVGFHGHLTAVNVGGDLQGFLTGDDGMGVHFLGNVSATFSSTDGFSSSGTPGTIGAGTATNTAIVTSGSCKPESPAPPQPTVTPKVKPNPPHPDHPGKGPKHHDHHH